MKQLAFVPSNDKPLGQMPVRERPAYRVSTYGAQVVSLAELLACIIGGSNQLDLEYSLIGEFNGLIGLARASAADIAQIDGIGPAVATRIVAAVDLGRRFPVAAPATIRRILRRPAASGTKHLREVARTGAVVELWLQYFRPAGAAGAGGARQTEHQGLIA